MFSEQNLEKAFYLFTYFLELIAKKKSRIGKTIQHISNILFMFSTNVIRSWSFSLADTGKSLSEALFLHQITHNLKTDCSLNYKFKIWKFQGQTWGEHVVYRNCFWLSDQFLCIHNIIPQFSAKWSASDKDLPVISYRLMCNV